MKIYLRKKKDGETGKETLLSPFYYYRFTYQGREYAGSTGTTDAELAKAILSKKHTMAVEGRQLDIKKPQNSPTW